MSVEVKIPAVGESISSGVVSVWHKKSGEFVQAGDALFTLETDKVSTEITAEKAGLLETLVPEGREVKIGEVVATGKVQPLSKVDVKSNVSGKVTEMHADIGGFLGIMQTRVKVLPAQFKLQGDRVVLVDVTAEQAKALPKVPS